MKMKKKARITAIIMAVTMIFAMAPLLPMNAQTAFAEDVVTEPVTAEGTQPEPVNANVSVQGKGPAVKASTESGTEKASVTVNGNVTYKNEGNPDAAVAAESYDGEASVTVNGNVTSENEGSSAAAVSADCNNGKASVKVTGDVNVQGENNAYGAEADLDFEATGSADVNIGGTVTVKGNEFAGGIGAYNGTVTVGKDVSVEGSYATGVIAEAFGSDHIAKATINGAVTATGERALGVIMESMNGIAGEGVSVKIGKGVTATSTITEEGYYFGKDAYGLIVQNEGGNIQADITGDVSAKAPSGKAVGIEVNGERMNEWLSEINGKSTILVHGNVISDGVGIQAYTQDNMKTDILIEDVLDAKDVGVLLQDMRYHELIVQGSPSIVAKEASAGNNLNLTVWKVNLNANGNVAEIESGGYIPMLKSVRAAGIGDTEREAATDFEKNNILYIVKIEQPAKGGKLSATDENGKALAKSHGYDVAKEGNKVLLKIDKQEGFELVAAYNGKDKVPLLKDADGNYYIVVPKGGGIYLSAVFKELPKQVKENTEKTIATAAAKTKTSAKGNTVAVPAGGFKAGLVLNGEEAEKGGTEDLFWKNMQLMEKADPTCTMTCLASKDADEQKANFEKLYEEGYDLILCTDDMADLVKEEAEKYPDQHFIMIGGEDPQFDNIANVIFTDGGKVMKKAPNERQVSLALNDICDMEKAGLFEGGQYKYDTED